MMNRTRIREHGINVLATVLMLSLFFLVIGFGIGALSTMNLNLSGRSILVTRSNQIAESAVEQVMYCVDDMTNGAIKAEGFDLQNLTYPSLKLDAYYDGKRHVFEHIPGYLEPDCAVDVHFVKQAPSDTWYSTDNSNNPNQVNGAQGTVPPYAIDLMVTVKVRDFITHYQIALVRIWDYTLSCEKGSIHILSGVDTDASPIKFQNPSFVKGEVYAGIDPRLSTTPEFISTYVKYNRGDLKAKIDLRDYVSLRNRIPFPPSITYPASITVGAHEYKTRRDFTSDPPADMVTDIGQCSGNDLQGRGRFTYLRPDSSPPWDVYVYPGNNNRDVRFSIFNSRLNSPFGCLKFVSNADVPENHYLNETNYYPRIREIYALLNKTKGADVKDMDFYANVRNYVSTCGAYHGPEDHTDWLPEYYRRLQELQEAYGPANKKPVYLLTQSMDIKATNYYNYYWQNSVKYILKDKPLVDEAVDGYAETPSMLMESKWGMLKHGDMPCSWSCLVDHYTLKNRRYYYQVPDNTYMNFDNTVLLAENNIEFSNTSLKGDNALIQVRGDLLMKSGQITAGQDVGMVLYSDNFYVAGGGNFSGILMIRKCAKLSAGNDTAAPLKVRGTILVRGDAQDGTTNLDLFDSSGLVVQGTSVEYDPTFMRGLHRFGRLRVAGWKTLD